MSSKHDIMTAAITICLLASVVGLVLTHNENAAVMTALISALVGALGYWFARGGSIMAGQGTPDPSIVQPMVQAAVTAELNNLAQTPATGGVVGGKNNVSGSGGN